jgi:hypothetical protein
MPQAAAQAGPAQCGDRAALEGGRAQRRPGAEPEARQRGRAEAHRERPAVETKRVEARQVRRQHGGQPADEHPGAHGAGEAGDQEQRDALGQQEARHAHAAGAEGGEHGQLALADGRAHEQHVGDVREEHQQEDRRSGDHRDERGPHRPDDRVEQRRRHQGE